MGFSLTIETYLHGFALDFNNIFFKLLPYSLLLAISVCVLEVILGLTLLINFQTKWILRGLFILTSLFTLLTLYTLWLKRVDNCGCLSDALPLAPYQSFLKNILILFILYTINKHSAFTQNQFPLFINLGVIIVTAILSSYMGWYTYQKLPIIDFGPYPVGTAISINKHLRDIEHLETAEIAVNSTNGTSPFSLNNSIAGSFVIWDEEKEITPALLQDIKLLCIVQRTTHLNEQAASGIAKLYRQLAKPLDLIWLFPLHIDKEHIPTNVNGHTAWAHTGLLRSMIKADIGFILLQDGIVIGKWSYKDLHKLRKHLNKLGLIIQD
jgi:uncharacterized membrane protein YphA (DoxX/SURF4 family)